MWAVEYHHISLPMSFRKDNSESSPFSARSDQISPVETWRPVLWLALYNTQTNTNYLRFPLIFFCKIFNTNLFDGFKILDQIYRKLCQLTVKDEKIFNIQVSSLICCLECECRVKSSYIHNNMMSVSPMIANIAKYKFQILPMVLQGYRLQYIPDQLERVSSGEWWDPQPGPVCQAESFSSHIGLGSW